MKPSTSGFESLGRGDLHALCDGLLLTDNHGAIEGCIAFLEAETLGLWHGRARAMMARRLKHCRLSQPQQTRVVHAILERFTNGRFSEQFKDQLRLVLRLAPERTFKVARSHQGDAVEHIRRYAAWMLSHKKDSPETS
jgi:hypothetical protein